MFPCVPLWFLMCICVHLGSDTDSTVSRRPASPLLGHIRLRVDDMAGQADDGDMFHSAQIDQNEDHDVMGMCNELIQSAKAKERLIPHTHVDEPGAILPTVNALADKIHDIRGFSWKPAICFYIIRMVLMLGSLEMGCMWADTIQVSCLYVRILRAIWAHGQGTR